MEAGDGSLGAFVRVGGPVQGMRSPLLHSYQPLNVLMCGHASLSREFSTLPHADWEAAIDQAIFLLRAYNGVSIEKVEMSDKFPPKVENIVFTENLQSKALEQSPRLAALLMLAIADSAGAQQSVVMDELDNDEDGVTAWAKLIKHFEQSTQEVRVEHLLHQWENDALKPEEHPDELYGRLTAIRRRLEKHGEVISDANLTRRFVSAIERQEGDNDI